MTKDGRFFPLARLIKWLVILAAAVSFWWFLSHRA